jgi:hypothetical protein
MSEGERLAPLERGTLFEAYLTTSVPSGSVDGSGNPIYVPLVTPTCILSQGQSFRGEVEELILLSDLANVGNYIFVGTQGVCKFPLTWGIGITLRHINPSNVFYTSVGPGQPNGVAGLILHIIGGGIV